MEHLERFEQRKNATPKLRRKTRATFMKLLIGIMYCFENEFGQCIKAIKDQTYRDFDTFVIKRRPNKEAHDLLYRTFMEKNSQYDLFIKIDADMVLARPTLFAEVVEYFQQHPEVDNLQIALDDFFCDRRIYGLHVYGPRYRWKHDQEQIFVDRRSASDSFLMISDNEELAPAAFHCPNPGCFQSYHYGLHRAVKIMQHGAIRLNYDASMNHFYNLTNIVHHYNRESSLALAFAILGAFDAISQGFRSEHVDFGSQQALAAFSARESATPWRVKLTASVLSRCFTLVPRDLAFELLLAWRDRSAGFGRAVKQMRANLKSQTYRRYERKKRHSA